MYRDAPLTGAACYKHAAAPMAAGCARCGRELCDPCIVYDLSSPHCIDCARIARRRRSIGAAAKIAGVLAVVAGGVLFLATRPPTFDSGGESPQIVHLHNKVAAARCDKKATLEYDEALVAADNARGALADTADFFMRCGDWYRLRWVTYSAYQRVGDHLSAVGEASKLIEHDPRDHDYVWWRGIAYQELGRPDDAITDYRRALALTPELDRIPFNLSTLLEQKAQFCPAREPILQFVRFHPEFASAPNVVDRLTRLRILGHCPADPTSPSP